MSSNALEVVICVLRERSENLAGTTDEYEAEVCEGFASCLEGESICERGLDDTSHHWKQGWRAANKLMGIPR